MFVQHAPGAWAELVASTARMIPTPIGCHLWLVSDKLSLSKTSLVIFNDQSLIVAQDILVLSFGTRVAYCNGCNVRSLHYIKFITAKENAIAPIIMHNFPTDHTQT